jgi:hypothetical protein
MCDLVSSKMPGQEESMYLKGAGAGAVVSGRVYG